MNSVEFLLLLELRLSAANLSVAEGVRESLGVHYQLLAKWNRRMNLSGFDLDSPSAAAIDRLFVEPLLAAAAIPSPVGRMLDIGSGGGSPGIPMALALRPASAVLAESKARKCVFLRQVVTTLGLASSIAIRDGRMEEWMASTQGTFDLITIRAVRIDETRLISIGSILSPAGLLCLFQAQSDKNPPAVAGMKIEGVVPLRTTVGGRLVLMRRG